MFREKIRERLREIRKEAGLRRTNMSRKTPSIVIWTKQSTRKIYGM